MALSSYPNSPFYNPSYWPDWGTSYQKDPLNTGYAYGEQHQDAPWTRRLAQMGFGGTGTKDMWARGLIGRFQEGYGAQQQDTPGLGWQEYLDQQLTPDKLNELWNQESPVGRGENTAAYAPNARWMRRA